MATQFFVPGPAQIWVGTGGVMPTRIVFGGGGPNCLGANAVVTAVSAGTLAVQNFDITDPGNYFVRPPCALTVGGGWGLCRRGSLSGEKVTGLESIPEWPTDLLVNGGLGQGFRSSNNFSFEFLGWTEAGIAHDITSPFMPMRSDRSGDMAADASLQGKQARLGFTLKRYNQDVLEAALARCQDSDGIGSFGGITSVPEKATTPRSSYPRPVGAGAFVQAQFCFFPVVILCPYAYTPPKRWHYGRTDEDGNEKDGLPNGYHFPVAVVESLSETTSWRSRRVTLSLACNWVSNPMTRGGLLYDNAVACVGNNPIPG